MLLLSVNTATCVDVLMAPAEIDVKPANVDADVRVLKSAACATLAVVTPVPTITSHRL
jgi:hypothetical protein